MRSIHRRHGWLVLTGVALAVMGCSSAGTTASPSPSPTTAAPAAATPEAPPTSAPANAGRSPARQLPYHCRAADLRLVSTTEGGAAGHLGYDIVVVNRGGRSCALLGDRLTAVYREDAGRIRALPVTAAGTEKPASPMLAPGRQAQARFIITDGYGGYDPSSPACAHPAVYRDLSATFRGGGLLPLTGLVLDVKCDGITAQGWMAAP
jgi:hypothetical protein